MEADFKEVYRAVYKARAKWFPIGSELGVQLHIITTLSDRDPPERNLAAILTSWLKDPDLKPCWASLVEILREITVDEKILATEIIKKHLGMLYECFRLSRFIVQVIVRYSTSR